MHREQGERRTRCNHSGPAGDWALVEAVGVGEWACGLWRQAERVRDSRTGEPLVPTGNWAQVNDGKVGENGKGMAGTGSHEEILGTNYPW